MEKDILRFIACFVEVAGCSRIGLEFWVSSCAGEEPLVLDENAPREFDIGSWVWF